MNERSAPRIGVLVVAYNAASTLSKVLDRIPKDFRHRIERVLVFDDASADSTFLVGLGYQAAGSDLPLELVRHEKNLGYGGNQKAGYRRAMELDLDIIVLLHGDGQYAPELLPEIVLPLESGVADAVFGSRMMEKGAARKGGMPLYKFVGNRILTKFENTLLGSSLSEFHSGYRAYSVAALKELDFESYSDVFDFDTEIIIGLHDRGKRIVEVPIPTYYGDEICYVEGVKYAKDVITDVLRYRAAKAGLGQSGQYMADPGGGYGLKEDEQSSHHQLLRWLPTEPARILDVGCSTGLLADRMSQLGHTVTGIDVEGSSEVTARMAHFLQADLDRGLPAGLERYDVVVCADVLEHVRRPGSLLDELRSCVAPGGYLLVSVPNFAHWYPRARVVTGRFDYDQRGILDHDHVRFFTKRSFTRLVQTTGWRVANETVTGIPTERAIARGGARRAIAGVEQLGLSVWPTLFAYQILMRLEPVV